MGKRKLHAAQFYQCDYTGLCMAASNCYMPSWTNGRLVRKGSYCNWESVMSHAKLLLLNEAITPDEFDAIRAHVIELLGGIEPACFAYSDLAHVRSGTENSLQWSAEDLHAWCCQDRQSVEAVKITAMSEVQAHTLEVGKYAHLSNVLTEQFTAPLRIPLLQRRGASTILNSKHQRSYILYCNSTTSSDNLEYNSLASSLCKDYNVYGDAYVVQVINEQCFMHRERIVNFTVEQFNSVFKKKSRKRSTDSTLTKDQYGDMKAEMQKTLNSYEANMSQHAQMPMLLANASLLKPASAKELLSLARAHAIAVQ